MRHIKGARTCRRFPVALEMIRDGCIHLTGLALLSSYLTVESHAELLAAAAGSSKAEIEALLRARFPKPDVPERVRPAFGGSAHECDAAHAREFFDVTAGRGNATQDDHQSIARGQFGRLLGRNAAEAAAGVDASRASSGLADANGTLRNSARARAGCARRRVRSRP
jgi:hypothetical protein